MGDEPTDGDEERESTGKPNLIVFPGGKQVDPDDVGADYIVRQSGDVPTPDIVDPVAVDAELRDRKDYVAGQELVRVIGGGGSTADGLDVLMKEIAEELAHLKFERRKVAKEGKSTERLTVNRIASLRSLADLLLKRKEQALAERLDLQSPRVQAMMKLWMEYVYVAMEKSGLESHVIDLVFRQMRADMVEWEKRMEAVD